MAKMSKLDALLTGLSEHSRGITEAVNAIRELLSGKKEEKADEPKPLSIEEVRAVLLEKRKAGFRDEIKALLLRHGADRLTDIDPTEYRTMMAEAEEIGK